MPISKVTSACLKAALEVYPHCLKEVVFCSRDVFLHLHEDADSKTSLCTLPGAYNEVFEASLQSSLFDEALCGACYASLLRGSAFAGFYFLGIRVLESAVRFLNNDASKVVLFNDYWFTLLKQYSVLSDVKDGSYTFFNNEAFGVFFQQFEALVNKHRISFAEESKRAAFWHVVEMYAAFSSDAWLFSFTDSNDVFLKENFTAVLKDDFVSTMVHLPNRIGLLPLAFPMVKSSEDLVLAPVGFVDLWNKVLKSKNVYLKTAGAVLPSDSVEVLNLAAALLKDSSLDGSLVAARNILKN